MTRAMRDCYHLGAVSDLRVSKVKQCL